MTAKQQRRRVASTARRKRRIAARAAIIDAKMRIVRVEFGRLQAELARYQREDELRRLATAGVPTVAEDTSGSGPAPQVDAPA